VDQLARKAAQILRTSNYTVALTGAGISTPSGIPDFRSPGYGLWQQVDPMEVASRWGFERHPEKFYAWVRPLASALAAARPNSAHRALAALEAAGLIQAIITQNVDGLHQRAGSRNVIEVHGHLREATCLVCDTRQPDANLLEQFRAGGQVPRCACGGVLKPSVVLFGEPLPADAVRAAEEAIARCDAMLVAGSSLEVIPVGDWPAEVAIQGGNLIIVNQTPTPLDHGAAVVIHGDVSEVLPAIARLAGIRVWTVRQRIRRLVNRAVDRLVPQV
jgi:NAD-dependent deacetylase